MRAEQCIQRMAAVSIALLGACSSSTKFEPPVYLISLTPTSATVEQGKSLQLSAKVIDLDGNPVQAALAWSSTDQRIASVGSAGMVLGAGEGTVQIAAAWGGAQGTSQVNVVTPVTKKIGGGACLVPSIMAGIPPAGEGQPCQRL